MDEAQAASLRPMTYSEFRERCSRCGLIELNPDVDEIEGEPWLDPSGEEGEFAGCRFFQRMVMGVGTPCIPVEYDGEDALLYPPKIRSILSRLHVPLGQFLRGPDTENEARSG